MKLFRQKDPVLLSLKSFKKVSPLNFTVKKKGLGKRTNTTHLVDNLPNQNNQWINTRHLLVKEHLIGKPTLLVNIDYFPSVLNYLMNLDFTLENRANMVGFGGNNQDVNTLRDYVLYQEFPYPVFKSKSYNAQFILQLLDQDGTLVSTYKNELEVFERLTKDVRKLFLKSHPVQMKEFEWQTLEKPIERFLQPETLFQYPTFIERVDDMILVSDTFHNRIVKMRTDGHIENIFGIGIAGLKDGMAPDCKFYRPRGLFYDVHESQVFVADTNNNTIRKIDLRENFISTLTNCRNSQMENFLLRDDSTRIMLTEEYIEKKFIIERENEWVKCIPRPISVSYTACSKPISRPIDLFIDYNENCLYVAEMGYVHIWKIDLESGIVEDVLPNMVYKYMAKDFVKYISQVFPSLDPNKRNQFHNLFPEFSFLKHRATTQTKVSFYYLIESAMSISTSYPEKEYKIKQIKITPSITPTGNDNIIDSVTCNTVFSSLEVGFKNGSIIGGNKPKFNLPTSVVKIENGLFVSDTFNHVIRKLSVVDGCVETIKPNNLSEFGVIPSENHPHILPNGNLDENTQCGRILITDRLDFIIGSCLLKVRLQTPNNFNFAEKISSRNIDITFKSNGISDYNHISYIHNCELFDPDSFTVSDDTDWKSIKRKNRAYTSLPDLIESYTDSEMVLNIPIEIADKVDDNSEVDITFTTFIESSLPSNESESSPFTLPHHLTTASYAPFNLQTCKSNRLLYRDLEELEISERKEIRKEISKILEWDLQESIIPPPIKEDISSAISKSEETPTNEAIICNDSSQVFTDCFTVRIPIRIVSDSKLKVDEKRKLLNHQVSILVSPSPPLFKRNHHMHQFIATTNNI